MNDACIKLVDALLNEICNSTVDKVEVCYTSPLEIALTFSTGYRVIFDANAIRKIENVDQTQKV